MWNHPATLPNRLTVKQVHTELVLDFVDPGGIGGTTTCSPVPVACPGAVPELDKGKRESQAGEDRADSCYGHPIRAITAVEMARPGPGLRALGAVTGNERRSLQYPPMP